MRQILLDLTKAKTRRDVHETIASELGFPDYYGYNLDALYDCLTDISDDSFLAVMVPGPESELHPYLCRLAYVLGEAEQLNRHLMVHIQNTH